MNKHQVLQIGNRAHMKKKKIDPSVLKGRVDNPRWIYDASYTAIFYTVKILYSIYTFILLHI